MAGGEAVTQVMCLPFIQQQGWNKAQKSGGYRNTIVK